MSSDERRQKTLALIAALALRPAASLRAEDHLMADLALDSPKALQLMMDVEDTFGFEIGDEEASAITTVGTLLAAVERRG
jgi:acyl carrier protein